MTGGLGIKNAVKLAPSAFIAFAASALSLHNSILPTRLVNDPDEDECDTFTAWTSFSCAPIPPHELQYIRKVWDRPIADNQLANISSKLSAEVDEARILSASSPHSGDWLMAMTILLIGLRLSDEMIRIAVGFRLVLRTCEPHTCPCEKEVDARGLHGLSYRRSTIRQQRNSHLKGII